MEETYARIEDYLDDLLSPADRAAFEAAISADPELAAEVEQVRQARERLARQWTQPTGNTALTKTLQTLGQQHFGDTAPPAPTLTVPPSFSSRRWWLVAAAVAAAALIAWLLWPKADAPALLYAEYRRFPEAGFTLKGTENTDQALQNAARFFNQKNYAAALDAFQQSFATSPAPLEARFFAGLCQLELGKTAEADTTFTTLRDGGSQWAGEAAWYLALTYLRSKDLEKCIATLRQIQPGQPHADEASRLLSQLEKH